MNKYCRSVLLLVILVGFLSGCGPTAPSQQTTSADRPSVLQKVKRDRVIRAGIIPYPPFVIKDPNTGKYSGYFVDLMNETVKFMGDKNNPVRINYEETQWGGMVAGLSGEKFDIVVSGVFETIPRAMEVTWAKPCMYVGMSAVVKANDNRFKVPADLEKPGLTVAVAAGEVGHEYVQKFLPNAKPVVLQTADTAAPALEVSSGSAEVALAESVALLQYAKKHPEVKVIFAGERPLFTYATSVMVRRGDSEWLGFLNNAIDFLQLAGVTDRLDRKYNPNGDLWLSPAKPWASGRTVAPVGVPR